MACPIQILWFKRDLRIADHRPLAFAAQAGAVLPLYIVEPELWAEDDASARQWDFAAECLAELREDLARLGQPLVIRVGRVTDVLATLAETHPIAALWSHEETGNAWTFARDKEVAAWCRAAGIRWYEIQQNGTKRRLTSRDGWAGAWEGYMAELITPAPHALKPLKSDLGHIPSAQDLNLAPDPCPRRQKGGRKAGLRAMDSFFAYRAETYRAAMSTPVAGERACSRLSPYLTFGALSMREVSNETNRQKRMRQGPKSRWSASIKSFEGRLRWHCHFIQKLEDEPRIEFENLHQGYDGMRPMEPDRVRLAAWSKGETGMPFVDACMRYLTATGWLNFRMRAMVASVASYHLWLDWRAPGLHLARQFTDYEPGIHWSQIQMQSGVTGINTIRIYNPIKQGQTQDPTGVFTRKWVPELSAISDEFLQEPWKAPNAGSVLGKAYPHPIVDALAAAREAREKVWAIRKSEGFRDTAALIVQKHASRAAPRRRPRKSIKHPPKAQMAFSFDDPNT